MYCSQCVCFLEAVTLHFECMVEGDFMTHFEATYACMQALTQPYFPLQLNGVFVRLEIKFSSAEAMSSEHSDWPVPATPSSWE